MESMRRIAYILLVLGNTISYIEAGLFDPITNIFDEKHENTPGKVINSLLSPIRGNVEAQGPQFHPNKAKVHKNSRDWWNLDSASQTPIIQNIFKDSQTTTPDYDKIVAERFPQATNLLEKLKELNKLKEQQKQQQMTGLGSENKVTSVPSDIEDRTKYENNDKTTTESAGDQRGVMRSLTKKRFYFQVQPIRPEGENNITKETVYFVD